MIIAKEKSNMQFGTAIFVLDETALVWQPSLIRWTPEVNQFIQSLRSESLLQYIQWFERFCKVTHTEMQRQKHYE